MLAVLLLASLAWGATAELAHHHGARPNSPVSQSLLNTTQTRDAADDSSARFESSGANGSSSSSKTGTACLICQFHQNLSVTVFSNPPGLDTSDVRVLHAIANAVVQLSDVRVIGHGRAPPSNL